MPTHDTTAPSAAEEQDRVPAPALPEWVDLNRLQDDEDGLAATIESALKLELRALDYVATLAMPGNVQVNAAVNDARATAVMSFESSLFSDVRAFRRLVAGGFIAQAANLGRSMLLAMWKAEVCIDDLGFAERVSADQSIPDREVMLYAAHAHTQRRRPQDFDYEAETLAGMESDYATLSRLVHKQKGGANYQAVAVGDSGDAVIYRQPPAALLAGYGDVIVAQMALRAAESFMLTVPFLLGLAGIDRSRWDELADDYAATVEAVLAKQAEGGYADSAALTAPN